MNTRVHKSSALLLMIAAAACSRERARLVETKTPAVAPAAKADYREMVTQARSRQAADDNLLVLETARDQFMRDRGRLPSNLTEMVTLEYLPELPAPPDGEAFVMDPVAGSIRLEKASSPAESID